MITLAIPYYRGLPYLQKAVKSVQGQTREDWKLLICSDGPLTGEESDFLNSLKDSRIAWVGSLQPLGMVRNWNRCLDSSPSNWITLLHADDELSSDYVEQITRAIDLYPQAAAIFCQATVIDETDQPTFSFPDWYKTRLLPKRGETFEVCGEEGIKSLLRGDYIFCPTLCYNLEVLGPVRFNEQWRMVQDLDLKIRLLLAGEKLIGLPGKHYRYRRHSSNATVTYTETLLRFREEWELYQQLGQKLLERNWKQAAKEATRGRIIKLNLGYCIMKDLLRLRPNAAASKAKLLAQLVWLPTEL